MVKKLLPVLVGLQSLGALAAVGVVTVTTMSAAPAATKAKPAEVHEAKPAKAEPPPIDPRTVVTELYDGNDRFSHGVSKHRDMLAERKELATGQHPKAIVLSCSDSRVPPELVFDMSLGELFVVRSAGNIADKVELGSMEYAAEHLKAPVLVVMGHEKCGAVTAAAAGEPMPSPNMQALVDEIAPGLSPLKAKFKGEELVHKGVEANVNAVAGELIDRSPVLRKLVEEGRLNIVRAVYDLDTGSVRWLDIAEAGPEPVVADGKPAGEKVAATDKGQKPAEKGEKAVEAKGAGERKAAPEKKAAPAPVHGHGSAEH